MFTSVTKYEHITPILQNIHNWLPIRQTIHFKILLTIYKSINEIAPEYLSELVSSRKSSWKLRSSSQIVLQVSVSQLKSHDNCTFSVATLTLWNMLPPEKLHLFWKHTCSRCCDIGTLKSVINLLSCYSGEMCVSIPKRNRNVKERSNETIQMIISSTNQI